MAKGSTKRVGVDSWKIILLCIAVAIMTWFVVINMAKYNWMHNRNQISQDEQDIEGAAGSARKQAGLAEPSSHSPSAQKAAKQEQIEKGATKKDSDMDLKYMQWELSLLQQAVQEEIEARNAPLAALVPPPSYENNNSSSLTNSNASTSPTNTQTNSGIGQQVDRIIDAYQSNFEANANGSGEAGGYASNNPRGELFDPNKTTNANYQTVYADPASTVKSPFTLRAGGIITARTMKGTTSETPGSLTAMIEDDIYDTITGEYVLIPKGSELLGRSVGGANYGDERIPVCFDRIKMAKGGGVIDLPCNPGSDQAGYGGLKDKVNNHYGKLFGQIILLSVFQGLAAQEFTDEPKSTGSSNQGFEVVTLEEQVPVTDPETGETTFQTITRQVTVPISNSTNSARGTSSASDEFREALAQQTAQVGTEVTRRNLSVSPTLWVRPGALIKIQIVNDMIFKEPYLR